MNTLGKWALIGGLALAVIIGLFFSGSDLLPWLVAGAGLVVGLLNVKPGEVKIFLIAGTALTVALIPIYEQPYNPEWLTSVVLYVRVFITHALLVVALLAFLRTAKD